MSLPPDLSPPLDAAAATVELVLFDLGGVLVELRGSRPVCYGVSITAASGVNVRKLKLSSM
jgi:hypothetical protein